jgi:hypothetical protein
MSPIATDHVEHATDSMDRIAALKAKVAQSHGIANEKKPIADDYMYAFKYSAPLPLLGDDFVDVNDSTFQEETTALVARLSEALKGKAAQTYADLFIPQGECLVSCFCLFSPDVKVYGETRSSSPGITEHSMERTRCCEPRATYFPEPPSLPWRLPNRHPKWSDRIPISHTFRSICLSRQIS